MATSQEYILGRLQTLCPDAGRGQEFSLYTTIGLASSGPRRVSSCLSYLASCAYNDQNQAASSDAKVRDIRREGDNILITIL